jgi:hypothetical protein
MVSVMDTKIDMTYRFLQDDEPTDQQLLIIMQEVAEEARRGREKAAQQVIENIEREYIRIHSAQQNQKTVL